MVFSLVQLEIYIWPQGPVGNNPVGNQGGSCQQLQMDGMAGQILARLKFPWNPVQGAYDRNQPFLQQPSGII